MLSGVIAKLFKSRFNHQDATLTEYFHYIETAYPSNHSYKIRNKKLIAKRQLFSRFKKIHALLPQPLTSLVDLGSSKGYFVFSASEKASCTRALGIDVNEYDITMGKALGEYMENNVARFEKLRLHELAARIDEFGGAFQTVLVINLYQYLYFGSDPFPSSYLSHDEIFKDLRKICNGRIIFNNRVELQDCQNTTCIKRAGVASAEYSKENIKMAASNYFQVKEHGELGGYPLWTLEAL